MADVTQRLEATRHVERVESPYAEEAEGTISRDGRSALVNFKVDDREDKGPDNVVAALAAVKAAQRAHPDLRIEQFGEASADRALSKSFEDDFKQAEYTSLPVTLLILLIAFGALVAAAMPLMLAVTAVAATIGLIGPISQLFPVSESINSVVLLIGLAVGVDYAMFYLRREREERAAGRSEQAALEAAAATSGRAVLISGLTVMVAMAGMYLGRQLHLQLVRHRHDPRGGRGGGRLADGAARAAVQARRPRGQGPRAVPGPDQARHRRVARVVGDPRPGAAAPAGVARWPATALMLALAAPVVGMKTALPGLDTLPRELRGDADLRPHPGRLPGRPDPRRRGRRGRRRALAARSRRRPPSWSGARRAATCSARRAPRSARTATLASISIPIAGDGTNDRSNAALAELRDEIVPATFGQIEGVEANVTGVTAGTEDFNSATNSRLPYVFAFVLRRRSCCCWSRSGRS